MMTMIATDKKILVLGVGLSGLSVARYLSKKGDVFELADTRSAPPNIDTIQQEFSQCNIHLGNLTEELLNEFDQIIVSPGLDLRNPPFNQVPATKFIGDVELFFQQCEKPVIAITGSNGKSTVTELTESLLKRSGINAVAGGNIGLPVLDLLETDADVFVLELSSFQLDTTYGQNSVSAVVLNISEDHMDRYDRFEDYINSKLRVYKNTKTLVINKDDPLSQPLVGVDRNRVQFTTKNPDLNEFGIAMIDGVLNLCFGNTPIVPVSDVKLKGKHNLANLLAAFALCKPFDVGFDSMAELAREFAGLDHRCQWVATKDGVQYIDDSKGTNVGSTVAAIEGLIDTVDGNLLLIIGGDTKGADLKPLFSAIDKYVQSVAIFGQDKEKLYAGVSESINAKLCLSLDESLAWLQQKAKSGDVVLLSPAAASIDMYKNYIERGLHFKSLVEAL